MVRPMVFSLVVLISNALRVPTLLFARVSCLLNLVGFGRRPSFRAWSAKRVWGISGITKKKKIIILIVIWQSLGTETEN